MSELSSHDEMQQEKPKRATISSLHERALKNSIFLNNQFINRSSQKEIHLELLIVNEMVRIFSLLQLIIVNFMAAGILPSQIVCNIQNALQQELVILEIVVASLTSIKFLFLLYLLFAKNHQKLLYKLTVRVIFSTRLLYTLVVPAYSLRFGNQWYKDILFGAMALLILIQRLIFSNFVHRNNADYSCEMKNSVFLCITSILSVGLNAHYITQKRRLFHYFIAILGWVYLFWYLKIGHFNYLDSLFQKTHFLLSSGYFSLIVVLTASLASDQQTTTVALTICIIITFIVITAFFKFIEPQYIKANNINVQELKSFELKLLKIGKSESIFQTFQQGFISIHQQQICSNEKCYTISKQVYDSQNHVSFSYEKKSQAVELRLKLIIKCFYESSLKENPQNKKVILDYLQFTYNELKNQWTLFKLYKMLNNLALNFFERMRMEMIFLLMKVQKQALNRRIYKSKMEIQNILRAEDTFMHILSLIQQYFLRRRGIVDYLRNVHTIEVQRLKKDAVQSFQILQKINKKWKGLKIHQRINKKWEYFQIICSLFLSNKILSNKMIDKLQIHENDKGSEDRPIFLTKNENLQNENTLFHFQSFYIHATNEKEDIIIKRISKNAEKFLQYQQNELIGSKIERLMVQQLKEVHYSKLKQWFQKGLNTNQYTYNIKFAKLVDKLGTQTDVLKYFKILLTEKGEMDYICLIKINTEQHTIALRNSEKDLKKVFQFSSFLNDFNQIQPDRLAIFSQESTKSVAKPTMQNYISVYRKNQLNIFLKNQNFIHIVQQFQSLSPVKSLSRLFFMIVAIFMVSTAQYTNNELISTTQYSSNYLNCMTAYRLPILLDINYMKTIINMGNQTTIKAQIKSQTAQFASLVSNASILSTIYDANLNMQRLFAPIPADEVNRNLSYDQIDLFYQISSEILTLSTLPVNRTSKAFKNLNSYLFPSYSTLMNNTKYAFHNNFQILFADSKQIQLNILVGFICFSVLYFCLILYKSKQSFNSLGCVINVLTTIRPNYLSNMATYDANLFNSFRKFAAEYQNQHSCQKMTQFFDKNEQKEAVKESINLNKNSKQVIQDEAMNKLRKFIYATFIFVCTTYIGFIVASKLITINHLQDLADSEIGGFSFLRYYPTAPIVGLGVFDKYYTLSYPKQKSFYPTKYANGLNDMTRFGQATYLNDNSQHQSLFYTKRRSYFFGNPCSYNPSLLTGIATNVSQCESVLNGTYKRGLIAYFRYAYTIGNGYINGNLTLNASQVSEFALGVTITSTYVLDAIATWASQFNKDVSSFQLSTLVLACCCISVTLVLHVLLLQLVVFVKLEKQFEIEQKLLNHFIPEMVLLKQKVVLLEFVKNGLIDI